MNTQKDTRCILYIGTCQLPMSYLHVILCLRTPFCFACSHCFRPPEVSPTYIIYIHINIYVYIYTYTCIYIYMYIHPGEVKTVRVGGRSHHVVIEESSLRFGHLNHMHPLTWQLVRQSIQVVWLGFHTVMTRRLWLKMQAQKSTLFFCAFPCWVSRLFILAPERRSPGASLSVDPVFACGALHGGA